MSVFRLLIVLVIGGLPVSVVSGAEADSLVKYTPDFKFKEGVYTEFSDVIYNSPIPKGRIITDVDYNNTDFFTKVLSRSKLYYIDNVGNRESLKPNNIWGYSRNGFLYVRIGEGYYRITLVGNCSHFVAYKTYETRSSPSPYYNSYQYPYSNSPTVTTHTEMQQYILDFKTGRIIEYDVEGIEIILMHDPELHDEYTQLSNKKKKQLKFVFIRKYNQRNPLFLINKN